MKQLRFSRCLRCGGTYSHLVNTGYGPLYCLECRPIVEKAKSRERQRKYRARKAGKR